MDPESPVSSLTYVRPEIIWLREHPDLTEKWVQDRIADDPSLLGLGELVLKDKERLHPKAGRLDLLLQDPESKQRFEVEVQLGRTDESHIMRTIEYWDIERKRYPQYDHTAVLVAEDITSRFLNVINLFNGFIPMVAIQMRAYRMGSQVSLIFTTVLDQMRLGLVDDDEEVREVTDRAYWEKRTPKPTLAMADELLDVLREWDPDLTLKYNRAYIGLAKNGRSNNFVTFSPRKEWLQFEARLDRSDEVQQKLEGEGLDLMPYSNWGTYRIRLSKTDIKKHEELIREVLKRAYDEAYS